MKRLLLATAAVLAPAAAFAQQHAVLDSTGHVPMASVPMIPITGISGLSPFATESALTAAQLQAAGAVTSVSASQGSSGTGSASIANGLLTLVYPPPSTGGVSTASYLAISPPGASYASTPSTTANDPDSTNVLVIKFEYNASSWGSGYGGFVGKYASSATSTNSEYTLYEDNGIFNFLAYSGTGTVGGNSFGSSAMPTGSNVYACVVVNLSASATTAANTCGTSVASGSDELFTSTTGAAGSYTAVGSANTGFGSAGFNKNGASSAPVQIGNTSGQVPTYQLLSLTVSGGTGTTEIAPGIASQTPGATSFTGTDGAPYTLTGATLGGTSGGTSAPATQTALGLVQVANDGSLSVTAGGVVSALPAVLLANTTATMAPFAGLSRAACVRQSDDAFRAADYGTNGQGYSTKIGTAYGATLSAVAGYSVTDCSGHSYQPFAWLTDGTNHGGVEWTAGPPASQDWTNSDVATGGLVYNTSGSVSVANVSNLAVGQSVYDYQDGASLGVPISAVANETVTSAAALSTAVAVGDTLMDGLTRQTAVVQAVNGTTYTLVASAPPGFLVGHVLVDTTSGLTSTIQSQTPSSISFSTAIAHTINAGDELVIQNSTTASAAGATSSPTETLTVALPGIVAGMVLNDATQNKVVGTVASVSGSTVTLAANATIAVASGDTLSAYKPTVLNWMVTSARAGYPIAASYHAPYWQLAAHASFYPQVGDLIADTSNATPCIPNGTTITAIDSNPADVNWGQVTLSTSTVSDCPGGTSFQVRLPDASIASLDVDWFGIESAIYAATQSPQDENALSGGAAYRTVVLPDGESYPERPIWAYSYSPNPGQRLVIKGSGNTILNPYTDFGYGKFALAEGSGGALSQYGNAVQFRDFSIIGPSSGSGVGTMPSNDDGLGMGAGDSATNMTIQGFHSGYAFQGDHTFVYQSGASGNYCNIEFLPDVGSIGNQRIENDVLVAPRFASVCIAASNQFDSGTVLDTHVGFGPIGWYKEAPGYFDPYTPSGSGIITNSSLFDNWWEATGNSAILDASETSVLAGDLFAGAETNNDYQYAGDALANMYPGGKAEATIHVGQYYSNRVIGSSVLSDYADVTKDVIDVVGACYSNLFIGAEAFIGGNSAAKPAMECGSDGGGNAFSGQWNGVFHVADGTPYSGAPVALDSSGGVVPYNTSSATGYEGTAAGFGGNIVQTCAVGQECPVILNGSRIPYVANGSTTPGQLLTPTSGSSPAAAYATTGTLSASVGVGSSGSPGSNQIGYMDVR